MTEKDFSFAEVQFDNVKEELNELQGSLYNVIATLILQAPIGIRYEHWVLLHQIRGDFE